ncbi:MAG: gamma-glutamylcyclotransferase [Balneolaceae bacterium]
MEPKYIFVYGLLKSMYHNDPAKFVRKNCSFIGEASIPGKLFDLGTYPGAIYDEKSSSKVHGEIFQIIKNETELTHFLDEFEGVGSHFKQPNEYVRVSIPVKTATSIIEASTYLYNWNLEGLKVIDSGRYENEKGNR